MPRSATETDKHALGRIQRLCCLGVGGQMLMPDLIREMSGLIPSQLRVFFWFGPKMEIINSYGTLPAELKKIYFEQVAGTRIDRDVWQPYWECVGRRGSRLVQRAAQIMCVDERTFVHSHYYNLLIRPIDGYEPLMMPIRDANRIHGMFFIWRAVGEVPFDARKLSMLEAMAGFIAHGMTPARVDDDAFADSDARALFVADPDGTLRYAGTQAQQLLMMALNPSWSPTASFRGLGEPMPEIAWLCRTLAATARGEIGHQPPVLRLRNQWGKFVLRAYWLEPTDGTEPTRRIGVTLERRVPRALALRGKIESLPLTGREKQFCLLLSRDPSGRDLSDAMGLAPNTVISHQRSVYAKLCVHSRAELLAELQRS